MWYFEDRIMDEKKAADFFNRFKDYKKPSLLQKEFLDLYPKREKLDELRMKKLSQLVKTLDTADQLHKQKLKLNDVVNAQKKEERKEDNHAKIILGGALSKAVSENVRFKVFFNALIQEGYLKDNDLETVMKFLNKLKKKHQEKIAAAEKSG